MTTSAPKPLRAITYLAPGIPLEFFQCITDYLARTLDRTLVLESDGRTSGPMHGDHDPFAEGRAELGFLCSPSYLYLRALPAPSVELVPAGFVFQDPRNQGRPHYFSDVIVRSDRGVARLEEIRHGVFGFNDTCSLSGYLSARQELAEREWARSFFSNAICTGSHDASIRAVLAGDIDLAAIDSNALALAERNFPTLREQIRVLESWGPHPIQPIVLSTATAAEFGPRVRDALLVIADDPVAGPALRGFGLQACVPIDPGLYEPERLALEELGQLPTCSGSTRARC